MIVARMGVWGKGQQSLAPPQHTVPPEREQRFGLVVGPVNYSGRTEARKPVLGLGRQLLAGLS